jgi:hypothetical protein
MKRHTIKQNREPAPPPYDHGAIYKFNKDFSISNKSHDKLRNVRQAIINAARRKMVTITTRVRSGTVYVWILK